MVRNGEFREDLLYRINTIHLHIPALRERKEDILPLAKRFLEQYARQYGRQVQASVLKLRAVCWNIPGMVTFVNYNIR